MELMPYDPCVSSCPSCANPVAVGSRFCPTCGFALAASTAEERRVVTVLFADLVGFTSLSENLDPEQVKRLIDVCFERLVADITAFGGTVDKLMGDGIVALFGVPVAHEDDAERAVRAGLRMQESLATFASSGFASDSPSELQMRVGINTGVALVGIVAGTDHTAMGDVVNTASRLQSLAPPGGVLVGETTYALSEANITYASQGELAAKGREAPVAAWLAVAAVAQPGARVRRRDVPMMGRSTELALMQAAVDFTLTNSQAALVAVDGEGGVGKGRMVDELLESTREAKSAFIMEGYSVPYGEANVWWPIATALFGHFDLDASTYFGSLRETTDAFLAELFSDADAATRTQLSEALLHLLGAPSKLDDVDPVVARDGITRAVTAVLEARLRSGPVMLSITDLHWADPAVLALCEHLLIALARSPFVLITTNRPDSELVWPPLSTRAAVVRLPLEPLGQVAAARLCRAIIGDDADEAVISTIYERSGGNPLFLEELAVLVADGGDVAALPDSLRAVVAARLDRLPPDQRAVIDNAAVLGPSGAIQSLERFSDALGQQMGPGVLDALADLGLLELDGRRWSFRSDSVREVAYQTLTKAVRAARHMGVAMVMESRHVSPDEVAHHLAAAAELVSEIGPVDLVPADINERALVALEAATKRAIEQGNLRLIVRYSSRAIELLELLAIPDKTRGRRAELRLGRLDALIGRRQLERARVESDSMLTEAMAAHDQATEACVRRARGVISQVEGDLATARRQLGEAVAIFRLLDDPQQLADTLRARGFLELFGGSLADAEWLFGEAEGLYTSLGDRRGLSNIEQHRGFMSFLGGDINLAEERINNSIVAMTELGDRAGLGWAYGVLAFIHFYNRRFPEAEALATQVRAEARERGDEWAESIMMSLLANLRLWSGQIEAAAALAEQALNKFKRLGDGFGLRQALTVLGRTQVAVRDPNVSRTTEALLAQTGDLDQPAFSLLAAAGIAMHAGDGKTTVLLAEEAVRRLNETFADPNESRVVLAVGLAQTGRYDEAHTTLAQVSLGPDAHPFMQAAVALVAALQGRSGEAIEAATRVSDVGGHTYLDGVIAGVAAAASAASEGDAGAARTWLEGAVSLATATQDQVATALALCAHQHVLGVAHERGAGVVDALGPGWRSVVDALPTLREAVA